MIKRLSLDITSSLGRIATCVVVGRIGPQPHSWLVFDSGDAAHNHTRGNATQRRGDIERQPHSMHTSVL